MGRKWWRFLWMMVALLAAAAVPVAAQQGGGFVFGLLLAGPVDARGWNQALYEGGKLAEAQIPGSRMIFVDNVTPAATPEIGLDKAIDDLVASQARLVIATSPDMQGSIRRAAVRHPAVYFVLIGGDDVITGKAPKNLSNLMGRMTVGQMMAGFAAAMTTRTGKIAFLGAGDTHQGRRQAAAFYLAARYGWEKVLKNAPADLTFTVSWIGNRSQDPAAAQAAQHTARQLFASGCDVIGSGIYSGEVLQTAGQMRTKETPLWALSYDDVDACGKATRVCLGAPFYNWGPGIIRLVNAARSGKWRSTWLWLGPSWSDINDAQTSSIGFVAGPALTEEAWLQLDTFTKEMGAGRADMFAGPLRYRDGSAFLRPGERVSDIKLWYMRQLLQGMQLQAAVR